MVGEGIDTRIDTSSTNEVRDEFNEDIVISLGDYHYRKYDKEIVRRGKKRSRYQGDVDTSLSNQVVWTQQYGDPQVDAVDTASALGAFTGANFHAIDSLNREFDKKKNK